jgi:hypothetical protein
MRSKQTVSVWGGNFKNPQDLELYLEMEYSKNEDFPKSPFTKQFKIKYYDTDFQEAYCNEMEEKSMTVKELLEPLSYSESYIEKVPNPTEKYNCIIALYNFNYEGTVKNMDSVDFIGVYDW